MGAFDTDKNYNASPYNGNQRMKSVTWIVITAVIGCVFIAKRLYFKSEKERLKKGDPNIDFMDVIANTILFLIWFQIIYGAPNPAIMYILMSIFMIGIAIGIAYLLRLLWNSYASTK